MRSAPGKLHGALAAIRVNDIYLAAQYARLKPCRGHNKALGAVKHSILIACWQMLATGELKTSAPTTTAHATPNEPHAASSPNSKPPGHHVTLNPLPT